MGNSAENGVIPLALDRKNYLFCGNHEAARRTAVIYSLPGACKINKVNLVEWPANVLNRISDCKMNDLPKLLPGQWMKTPGP